MTEIRKFGGAIEQLMWTVALTGIPGDWDEHLNGKHVFRSDDGAILNWWSSTGTVYLQGNTDAALALERAILRTFDYGWDENSDFDELAVQRPAIEREG